jgi:hypothetical protein
MLIGLSMAFGVFGPNPVSAYLASIVAFIPRAIVAIVIVVIAAFLARMAYDVIAGALGGLSYGKALAGVASAAIWFFGIIAALSTIGIATAVTMPIEIALLAALAGIAIVGVGGGLVRPMQARWERWLGGIERETVNVRSQWRERSTAPAYPNGDTPATTTTYVESPATAESTGTASQPGPASRHRRS